MNDKQPTYKFLTAADAGQWEAALARVKGKIDVFFELGLNSLFVKGDEELEAFCYDTGEKLFFLPYLKKPILGTGYFDAETPYGYSGPVASSNNSDFLNRAWEAWRQASVEAGIVALFLRFNPILRNHELVPTDFIKISRECFVVVMDLTDKNEERVFAAFKKNNRNKIRSAEKNGVTIERSTSQDALMVFHNMYEATMKRVGAESFYLFDQSFFRSLGQQLKGKFMVLTAMHEGEAVASTIVLHNESILSVFLSSTAKKNANGAANFLRFDSIRYAMELGLKHINFGGGRTNAADDSLLSYKRSFSDEMTDYFIGKAIFNEEVYNELCNKWEATASLDAIEKYGNRLLKYRY